MGVLAALLTVSTATQRVLCFPRITWKYLLNRNTV